MSGFDLVSNATVRWYGIRARVRMFERLEHITPVLAHVQDAGGATPGSVSEELCLESSELGGRLLDICEEKGLVTESGGAYRITPNGTRSVADQTVPVDADAVWLVCHVDHPIIPIELRMLYIDESTGRNQVGKGKGIGLTMECWQKYVGIRMRPISPDDAMTFEIVSVFDYVMEYEKCVVPLTWHVGKTRSSACMDVDIRGECRRLEFELDHTVYEDVRDRLFGRGWDDENGRLLVDPADLGDGDEYLTMKRRVFTKMPIQDSIWTIDQTVDLYPRDADAAQRWASGLVADRVANNAVGVYGEACQDVRDRFAEFSVRFMERNDLIRRIRDAIDGSHA